MTKAIIKYQNLKNLKEILLSSPITERIQVDYSNSNSFTIIKLKQNWYEVHITQELENGDSIALTFGDSSAIELWFTKTSHRLLETATIHNFLVKDHIPKKLYKLLSSYRTSRNANYFETEGDLEDIKQVIIDTHKNHTIRIGNDDLKPLDAFYHLKRLISSLWHLVEHNEFENNNQTLIKDFKETYPRLYNTLIIWGWG